MRRVLSNQCSRGHEGFSAPRRITLGFGAFSGIHFQHSLLLPVGIGSKMRSTPAPMRSTSFRQVWRCSLSHPMKAKPSSRRAIPLRSRQFSECHQWPNSWAKVVSGASLVKNALQGRGGVLMTWCRCPDHSRARTVLMAVIARHAVPWIRAARLD